MNLIGLVRFDIYPYHNSMSKISFSIPPIAYFSMEYGIDDKLPIFAGGLGVLAGDILQEISDQNKPFIAIGLFYHKGYHQQHFSQAAKPTEGEFEVQPSDLALELLVDNDGNELIIEVPISDQVVTLKVWKRMVGSVPLLLLDTRVDNNSYDNQNICDELYAGDKEHRLKQEIVLGIGGVRLLEKLGVNPALYHLNEAHSSFVILEVINQFKKMDRDLTFDEAVARMKEKTVFTNHTIVPAGNDGFSEELISIYLSEYATNLEIPFSQLMKMGKVEDANIFSMTLFALRHSKKVNAVSKLHAIRANERWPGFNFIPITNGVYMPRWLSPEINKVRTTNGNLNNAIGEYWNTHLELKAKMLEEVKKRTGVTFNKDVLTAVWARRITAYKRPRSLIYQLDRLKNILNHADKPVQILLAGKVHPQDDNGKQFIQDLHELGKQIGFQGHLQFVPNYDIELAISFVRGADIWLNTPLRGYEASGTSGMKACANGVLQMTTKDGWTDDVEWEELGWTLDNEKVSDDIYSLFEGAVTDLYYKNRRDDGVPVDWVKRMIASSTLARQRYSATRMVNDYYEKLYA